MAFSNIGGETKEKNIYEKMLYLSMWEKNISKTKLIKSVFQTPHDFKNDYWKVKLCHLRGKEKQN